MSVSFIINASNTPKNIREMTRPEINKLYKLLSGPVSQVNRSNVRIVKNQGKPLLLSHFTPHALSLLCISVGNFRSGYVNEVSTAYQKDEINLVITMAKNNANVSKAATSLGLTRDETRNAIKKFNTKWNLDLTTYAGLCQAYTYAMAS